MSIPTPTLLDRFCRYVRIDTEAVESAGTYPSSPGQLELGRMLLAELRTLGLSDAKPSELGIVMATIPATVRASRRSPGSPMSTPRRKQPARTSSRSSTRTTTAWMWSCPATRAKIIRVADSARICWRALGKTLITTDGTTLLGADDKAGVAVIMETAALLAATSGDSARTDPHLFTCDEEIGHGVDHVDPKEIRRRRGLHARRQAQGRDRQRRHFPPTRPCHRFAASTSIPRSPRGGWSMPSVWRACSSIACRARHCRRRRPRAAQGFLHPYRIDGGVAETTTALLVARLRSRQARRGGRTLAHGRQDDRGRVSAGEDRRAKSTSSIATWPMA